MITQTNPKTITLTASTTVLMSEVNILYYVTCAANLSGLGNVAITGSGTPKEGTYLKFICNFNTTNYVEATDYVSFFGFIVPVELATKFFVVECYYIATAWKVFINASLQNSDLIDAGLIKASAVGTSELTDLGVATGDIADLAITTAKVSANAITNAKLAQMTTLTIKGNDGGITADPQDLSVTEVRTILDQDITLVGDVTGTATEVGATGITTITTVLEAGTVGTAEKTATANTEVIYFPVSFETAEQGTIYIKFGYNCDVIEYFGSVTKALSATDSGTVILADDSGTTLTGSTMTFSASSIIGTNVNVVSGTITSNFSFTTAQTMRITTSKFTVGGKVMLSIRIKRT